MLHRFCGGVVYFAEQLSVLDSVTFTIGEFSALKLEARRCWRQEKRTKSTKLLRGSLWPGSAKRSITVARRGCKPIPNLLPDDLIGIKDRPVHTGSLEVPATIRLKYLGHATKADAQSACHWRLQRNFTWYAV